MAFSELKDISGSTLIASSQDGTVARPTEVFVQFAHGTITLGGPDGNVYPFTATHPPILFLLSVGEEVYASGAGAVHVLYSRGSKSVA